MNAPRYGLALPILSLVLTASVAAGCSSPSDSAPADEPLGKVSSPVIKGTNSGTSQDAVVLVVHYDPTSTQVGACTGTLLAANLVLTARHCVADTDEYAACDSTGEPLAAGEVRANHKPSTLYIFTGPNRPSFAGGEVTPDGQGAKILDDGGKNLCNHDIALIVLEKPIKDAKIAPIRLDSPILKGEEVTVVGWGVTDKTTQPTVRQQRTGITVEGVGPEDLGPRSVPPNEFEVGESICSGDSGGPALSSAGAILGIVSRGGNETKPNPQDPSTGCVGTLSQNLYTKVDAFKDFILSGYALVEADPWYENGADPRLAKPGTACNDGSECRSALCLPDPATPTVSICTDDCSASPCPDGETCTTEGGAQVCRATQAGAGATRTTTTTGCSSAGGLGSSGDRGAFALVLAALGVIATRRRRPARG